MVETTMGSPRIISSGWGKIEVESLGRGKDYKLWPGGGRSWDWGEHGTGHGKGVQLGDVLELITNGCEMVILTTGRFQRLRVPDEVVRFIRDKGIEVTVTDTKKGILLYNDCVQQGRAVGGLFHSTC